MRLIVFCIVIVLPLGLIAQKIDNTSSYRNIENESYFRVHYDNDYFAATDENYTQGYSFEVVLPILVKNPINSIFYKPENSNFKFGISLEHIGYTPNDYVSESIQFGDRPFAAAIMIKNFMIAHHLEKQYRLSQSLSIGLIGPAAFGKEMQVEIHKATGNKIPRGWDNQIKNDIVLNYRIDYEKEIYQLNNRLTTSSNVTLQLGTLFTNASVGSNIALGVLHTKFNSSIYERKFQIYTYAHPMVSIIGYDATLQGGLLNKASPYTISSGNIKRFTAQFSYGLVIKTKTLYFEYYRSTITKEFKSGASAKWGGIRIGFTF
ncbi:MAG: lipid A deacylase LpxR family protein [Winogradskyella sp.]|uniref:lipid A deacylase LpxR family protein n=1 Tax=Winogradskyella sp. TaxID=1883156 RepID=UPI0017EEA573|nr:lipid A deacylase LpxR family protein [Winogradskyella sp.]